MFAPRCVRFICSNGSGERGFMQFVIECTVYYSERQKATLRSIRTNVWTYLVNFG